MNFKEIEKDLIHLKNSNSKGFTYDILNQRLADFKNGYYVGVNELKDIKEIINFIKSDYIKIDYYVGYWYDTKENKDYWDIVIRFEIGDLKKCYLNGKTL